MHKFAVCLLLIAYSITSAAQQNRFIYIQTENKQPFYVKQDKKLFSSSASGYVIIPKLIDGVYDLIIGFPKNEAKPQNFQCVIDKKDVGFLLKDFGDKGWGLFDLQSLKVLMTNNTSANNNVVITENKTDAFSNMLSDVVKDPSIKQTETIVQPVTKEETKIEQPKAVVEDRPVVPVVEETISIITQTLNNTNADGTELVYIDKTIAGQDTIRIFIPADKYIQSVDIPTVVQEKLNTDKQAVKEVPKEEKFLNIELSNPNATVPVKKPQPPTEEKIIKLGSGCKETASDEDFLKLRKKMAAADSDDEMISVAKKTFKTKCFSTAQIKNLSFFFLKDDGKYQFLSTAYAYVSDKAEFKSLQNQLTDESYINKFKEMIQ